MARGDPAAQGRVGEQPHASGGARCPSTGASTCWSLTTVGLLVAGLGFAPRLAGSSLLDRAGRRGRRADRAGRADPARAALARSCGSGPTRRRWTGSTWLLLVVLGALSAAVAAGAAGHGRGGRGGAAASLRLQAPEVSTLLGAADGRGRPVPALPARSPGWCTSSPSTSPTTRCGGTTGRCSRAAPWSAS